MLARQNTGTIRDLGQLALHHYGLLLSERRRGIIALRVLLRQIEHCPHRMADLATHDHASTHSAYKASPTICHLSRRYTTRLCSIVSLAGARLVSILFSVISFYPKLDNVLIILMSLVTIMLIRSSKFIFKAIT